MNMKTFDITVRGASHIKKGTVCQDHSTSNAGNGWSYAIVCDGHGGNDYVRSDKGSEFCCKSAEFMINSMMSKISTEKFFSENESLLRTLEQRIIKKWRETVEAHYNNNPFTRSELSIVSPKACERYRNGNIYSAYGTTLVAVVMTRDYWFGIQIGDGKVITVDHDGNFHQPVPENPKCFANATASVCDKDAFDNFRGCFSYNDNPENYNSRVNSIPDIENKNHFIAYGSELPAAIIVSSDGIDNCFKEDEQMYNLYKTVLYSFGTSDFAEAEKGLKNYLPTLSQQGSGDDISVAAILDADIIPELSIVKEYDMNKQRQRVADAKRREQEADEVEKKIVAERVARLDREKMAEMQGKIDQLEKCLKQTQERLRKSEEETKRSDESLRLAKAELKRSEMEYNYIKNEYDSIQKNLSRMSDSIKICHDCKIVIPGRINCCTRCGKSITEYRKYTEKKERPWSRKNPDYPVSQDYTTPYPDNVNSSISDDDTIRKNTDIDVPISDDSRLLQEKIQKISDKKHENQYENESDESVREEADTQNIYQETAENIQDKNESVEDTAVSEETEAGTESTDKETAESSTPDSVNENSGEAETDENEETNADTESLNTAENNNDTLNDDYDDYDDDDDFEPSIEVGGILDDFN